MGAIIYVDSEIEIYDLTDEMAQKIENIEDGWGYKCFKANTGNHTVSFTNDTMEGCDPTSDGIDKPLKELLSLATKEEIDVTGYVSIKSDYGCYDNIYYDISDNKITEKNLEIVNATTEELLNELESRINDSGKDGTSLITQLKEILLPNTKA